MINHIEFVCLFFRQISWCQIKTVFLFLVKSLEVKMKMETVFIMGQKTNFLSRNSREFDVRKLWIFWGLRLRNRELCKKFVFEIVNLVKKVILKMWILWKVRFWKCDFLDKLRIFAPVCSLKNVYIVGPISLPRKQK